LKVLTTSQHQKRLNVFGWVAPLMGKQGIVRTANGDRSGFLRCLKPLYSRIRRKTIWLYVDNACWHKGAAVRAFLKAHPRLRLGYLPPYQPALNMQERIWRRVRYECTTNRYFEELDDIWTAVHKTVDQWTPGKIRKLCRIT